MKTSFRLAFAPVLALLSFFAASIAGAETETYAIDPAHSSVEFRVRHFFSKVTGRFDKFEGSIVVDRAAMEKSEAKAVIETASVNTNQPDRDKHLQTAEFFDVVKHPKMTFQSKNWKKISDAEFEVTGELTLHGVAKPVVLTVKSLGFGEGMKGAKISGWEIAAKIKRSDFGMTAGAPAVGDEVEIAINVEAKKQ
ncbi:MAG: YceI family protein [Verrucomicrobia bacterium]|nr:YceI family protein [Verrucomicrobiota bacterium]